MNAKTSFSYATNPYKVRKQVIDTNGNAYIVDGFGREVKDAPKVSEPSGFVTIGNSTVVHKNGTFGPICGAAGMGGGSKRGYNLQTKQASSSVVTCKRCLHMME